LFLNVGVLTSTDYDIKDNTVVRNIPLDDIARLMYYLHGVDYCLEFVDSVYTNFDNYNSLSNIQKQTVVALAVLLSPDLLVNKVMFITNDPVLLNGKASRYLEITQARNILAGAFDAVDSIVIEGRTINITKIMLCSENWLRDNYFTRLRNQAWRLENPNPTPAPTRTYNVTPAPRTVGGGGGGGWKSGGFECCKGSNVVLYVFLMASLVALAAGVLCVTGNGGSLLEWLCGSTIVPAILLLVIPGIVFLTTCCTLLGKCCK